MDAFDTTNAMGSSSSLAGRRVQGLEGGRLRAGQPARTGHTGEGKGKTTSSVVTGCLGALSVQGRSGDDELRSAV